ncbi:hypothetical protein EW15_2024 [Prochlorococcus sp. MIT 0801]|nr:hypothetical protein EW15_2024 [Prochlorococcus sp. MIT 0801]
MRLCIDIYQQNRSIEYHEIRSRKQKNKINEFQFKLLKNISQLK